MQSCSIAPVHRSPIFFYHEGHEEHEGVCGKGGVRLIWSVRFGVERRIGSVQVGRRVLMGLHAHCCSPVSIHRSPLQAAQGASRSHSPGWSEAMARGWRFPKKHRGPTARAFHSSAANGWAVGPFVGCECAVGCSGRRVFVGHVLGLRFASAQAGGTHGPLARRSGVFDSVLNGEPARQEPRPPGIAEAQS
jgi:hypothetical protein